MSCAFRGFAGFLAVFGVLGLLADSGWADQPQGVPVGDTARRQAGRPEFEQRHVLARFHPGAPAEQRRAARAQVSGRVKHEFRYVPGLELLEVRLGDVDRALEILRRNPNIQYAEPDYIVRTSELPNDPMLDQLWGMRNTGQTVNNDPGTAGADANAAAAWELWTGNPDFRVAIIDTGLDYLHPDLAENVWTNPGEIADNGVDDDGNGWIDDVHGYDFINNDPDPMDDNKHGTHVGGTIGAVGNNGLGVVGVNWRCKLVGLKFLGAGGSGPTSAAVLALEYAIANDIKVSNNSWGGGGRSQAMYDAIVASQSIQHLFIAAAGNETTNVELLPTYPASFDAPNMVVVAATDNDDRLASFSNYGEVSVDVGAPGVAILSTGLDESYIYLNGTSMATPHVAGLATLIYSRFPNITWAAAKDRILQTARPAAALAGRTVTDGVIDVLAAYGDCNGNSVFDEEELAAGAADCSGNGILDECEPDCNANHETDSCETFRGEAADCNADEIPDECQPDCNGNGRPDVCEIVEGLLGDCNHNLVPDECELAAGGVDCNENGVLDRCDVVSGTSEDCNASDVPDECELDPDCNGNGRPDLCDLLSGISQDCNQNWEPDDCETTPDCNGNDIGDHIELCLATAFDCNHNGMPDECEVGTETWEDCNDNGVLDQCEYGLIVMVYHRADDGGGINPERHPFVPKSPFLQTLRDAGFFIDMKNIAHPLNRPFDVVIRDATTTFPTIDEDVLAGRYGMVFLDNWAYFNFERSGQIEPFPASPVAERPDGSVLMSMTPTYRTGTTVLDPACPIVKDLPASSNLYGMSMTPALKSGVNTVITWNDGTPMLATHKYGLGRVVYLNNVSGWTGTGDWQGDPEYGKALLKNAILFAAPNSKDCNLNKVLDSCEIRDGLLQDVLPAGGDGIPDECQTDCNGNRQPDRMDIKLGRSADCDHNGVPDECAALYKDCNANGVPDACDIAAATSSDCTGVRGPVLYPANGIPDECDADCDGNGTADICELAAGAANCDGDAVPDACQPAACQTSFRVFWSGVGPSPLHARMLEQLPAEITRSHPSWPWPDSLMDYDLIVLSFLGSPFESGKRDKVDDAVANGCGLLYMLTDKQNSAAFSGQASPLLELGFMDLPPARADVLVAGSFLARNLSAVGSLSAFSAPAILKPDAQLIVEYSDPRFDRRPMVVAYRHGQGRVVWINTFSTMFWPNESHHDKFFSTELLRNAFHYTLGLDLPDCNENGLFDEDELRNGNSFDANGNMIPDTCDAAPRADADPMPRNRYVGVFVPEFPGFDGESTALRVELTALQRPDPPNQPCCPAPDFSAFEGEYRYVRYQGLCLDSSGESFHCAALTCDPAEPGVYIDWPAELAGDVVHISGSEIVPSSRYAIVQLAPTCAGNESGCVDESMPVEVLTGRWGDVAPPFQKPDASLTQPNVVDIAAQVDKVKVTPNALPKPQVQLQPRIVDPTRLVNVLEIAITVDAVKGGAYPYDGPQPCP